MEFVLKNPGQASRAKNYLDHLEIQRILKLPDAGVRYEKLFPFFLSRTTWDMREEARAGIVGCGKAGGEKLLQVFADPKQKRLRQTVMNMWREMGYREIVPLMINLLEEHDAFWIKQFLEKDWWSDQTNPELTARRQEVYGEIFNAVRALRAFRDPRAKDVLELTRRRWVMMNFDNPQIVEECAAALRELTVTK